MLSNSNHIFNWYTYIATIGTYDIAHSDEMLHKKIDIFFVGENIPKLQIMWNNAKKVKLVKQKKQNSKKKQNKTCLLLPINWANNLHVTTQAKEQAFQGVGGLSNDFCHVRPLLMFTISPCSPC